MDCMDLFLSFQKNGAICFCKKNSVFYCCRIVAIEMEFLSPPQNKNRNPFPTPLRGPAILVAGVRWWMSRGAKAMTFVIGKRSALRSESWWGSGMSHSKIVFISAAFPKKTRLFQWNASKMNNNFHTLHPVCSNKSRRKLFHDKTRCLPVATSGRIRGVDVCFWQFEFYVGDFFQKLLQGHAKVAQDWPLPVICGIITPIKGLIHGLLGL